MSNYECPKCGKVNIDSPGGPYVQSCDCERNTTPKTGNAKIVEEVFSDKVTLENWEDKLEADLKGLFNQYEAEHILWNRFLDKLEEAQKQLIDKLEGGDDE